MFDDLDIDITANEPTNGPNVLVRFGISKEPGVFSLRAVTDDLARLNKMVEDGQPPDEESWKAAGGRLFTALLGGSPLYRQVAAPGRKVRLRLWLYTPDLLAVPWEYLYDPSPSQEQALARRREFSIVRSLSVVQENKLVVAASPLRVLVMISNPSDLPGLDATAEWANLEAATVIAGIDLIRIDPTYEALQGALRQHQPHIFHFVGHGLFDETAQTGLLYFQQADGNAAPCPAEQVATLLTGCDTLRLALLNACQGATPGNRSAFAGVAQKLIQQGLPAVIAMQASILDNDALAFSQEFYRALADGYLLEAAVGEGRKRMADRSTAWGVPALYFQGSEPFAIPVLTDGEKAERLWQRARGAPDTRRRHLLEGALALNPNHTGAQAALTRLNDEAEAAHLYAAAVAYMDKQQWRDAQRTLEQIQKRLPNFRDTLSRLSEVLGHLPAAAPPVSAAETAQVAAYRPILNALQEGRLTLFLGDALGQVGRPPGDRWVAGLYPPNADDAARALAHYLPQDLPSGSQGEGSLLQMAQYTQLIDGDYALYDRLSKLYAGDFSTTILHDLLAALPARLAAKGYPKPGKWRYILFSTALDDLLERAFIAAGQPYHLFAYRPRFVDDNGVIQIERFLHFPPVDPSQVASAEPAEVLEPNKYSAHDSDNHPIIVKLCGRRVTTEPDSVAVTEDHFMNYFGFR